MSNFKDNNNINMGHFVTFFQRHNIKKKKKNSVNYLNNAT